LPVSLDGCIQLRPTYYCSLAGIAAFFVQQGFRWWVLAYPPLVGFV